MHIDTPADPTGIHEIIVQRPATQKGRGGDEQHYRYQVLLVLASRLVRLTFSLPSVGYVRYVTVGYVRTRGSFPRLPHARECS